MSKRILLMAATTLSLAGCASMDKAKEVRNQLVIDGKVKAARISDKLDSAFAKVDRYDTAIENSNLSAALLKDCEACKSDPNPADCLIKAGMRYQRESEAAALRLSTQKASFANAKESIVALGDALGVLNQMADAEQTATIGNAFKDYFKGPEGQAALDTAATLATNLFTRPPASATPPAETTPDDGTTPTTEGGDN